MLAVWAVGVFGQISGADALPVIAPALPVVAPAFGSAVYGQIDSTGCQSPEGSFNFLNGGNCFSSLSQSATSATGLLNDTSTGSFAAASANLATGAVRVSVTGVTGPTPGSAGAHALVWDTLTFSGAAPGASITLTMTGTASLSGDARFAAGIDFEQEANGIGQLPYALLEGNDAFLLVGAGDPTAYSGVPAYSFQETFGIVNNVPMFLGYFVDAFAGVSGCDSPHCPSPGSASITDPLSIDLPEGVTFTSASREALSSVPEPAVGVFLVGFGVIGWTLRGSRRKDAAAVT